MKNRHSASSNVKPVGNIPPLSAPSRPKQPGDLAPRFVTLKLPLKKPSKPTAKMKRVGIVPIDAPTSRLDPAIAGLVQGIGGAVASSDRLAKSATRADLVAPPNSGETDLNVVSHGGAIAPGVPVQIIFWGSEWTSGAPSGLSTNFFNAVALLLAGPFYTGLKQYGIGARPVIRGSAIYVTAPNPPGSFDDSTIGDLVWNMIDQGIFAEPDESGGRNAYIVIPAPGSSYGPGGALGAHSSPTDYDFPFDVDTAWVAWVGASDLNTMTRAFGHELAELCTDPEGDGWHTDNSGEEIGDICNSRRGFVNGVFVEGYWSNGARACVIPQNYGFDVSAVSRYQNQLDLFVTGNDGVVYTSWWTAGSDWSGINNNWRPIGGFFPVGAPLAAVSRHGDQLDLFVIGNDGVVYTSWWTAGSDWSGINNNWRPIGGFFPVGAALSAVSRHQDQLDLFVIGNDGVVYTSWWTAGSDWSGINNNWRPIGGFFPQGAVVSAVSRHRDQLDLFVVGNDGVVYTSWWTLGSDWSGINNNWRPIGGFFPPGTPVTVVSRHQDQLDLFVIGYDGVVYTSWWTLGSDWSGVNNNWRPIGGFFPISARVVPVSRHEDQLDLFVTGNDGVVYTSWWTAGSDWSGINNNWRPIGGFFPVGASLSAVSRFRDQLDVFVVGNDGVTYTSWWTLGSDWSGINNNWRPIGGYFPVGV